MNDRELLERALSKYPAAPGAVERLMKRKARKRRRQRIAAVIVAILLSVVTFGFVVKVFDTDASKQPAGIKRVHSITPDSVAQLKLVWTGAGPNQPLAMQGGVVLAADAGRSTLYAFDRSCASAGEECAALWTATSGSTSGTGSSPTSVAVDGSTVYLATQDRLSTLPLRCRSDGATCDPTSARDTRTWSWEDAPTFGSMPPAIADGTAYVANNGALAAYPTSCVDVTCVPTWTWQPPDGGPLRPPAIVGGDVLVQSAGGGSSRSAGLARMSVNPCGQAEPLTTPTRGRVRPTVSRWSGSCTRTWLRSRSRAWENVPARRPSPVQIWVPVFGWRTHSSPPGTRCIWCRAGLSRP